MGIGPADPDVNPFLRARLPVLTGLLGGVLPTLEGPVDGPSDPRPPDRPAVVVPLDATLGVDGLPQSGTGQASLLTGENCARIHGRHFGPWVPVKLRPLVEEESLLRRARNEGHAVAFANAYPRNWPGEGRSGRRVAGPPLAARGAGVLTQDHRDLANGDAVASEIVNDGWRRWKGNDVAPVVTPREAGRVLARVAARHTLTFFAHYATDTAGHRGGMAGAVEALERVDAFLGGVLAELPAEHTLMVVSDHGNLEDVRGGHTRNPALGVVAGAGVAGQVDGLADLTDVTPRVLGWLRVG